MKFRSLAVSILAVFLVATAAGQRTTFPNLPMGPSPTLRGNILTIDGRPVNHAHVEVRDLLTGSIVMSGFSAANGSFIFHDLPAGRYELRAVVGMGESRESFHLGGADQDITVRMTSPGASRSNSATVSVAALKVPGKAKREFGKAEEAFFKHKLSEAREHVDKALAAAPDFSFALTLAALLDLSEAKFDDAVQKAEQSVQSDGNYGMGYVVLASAYNSVSRFDDAVRALDRGIPMTGNSWQSHFELSKALLGKRDYARALSSLDRALPSAPPDFATIHLVRAQVLIKLNQFSGAEKALQTFVSADPRAAERADVKLALAQLKERIAAGAQ